MSFLDSPLLKVPKYRFSAYKNIATRSYGYFSSTLYCVITTVLRKTAQKGLEPSVYISGIADCQRLKFSTLSIILYETEFACKKSANSETSWCHGVIYHGMTQMKKNLESFRKINKLKCTERMEPKYACTIKYFGTVTIQSVSLVNFIAVVMNLWKRN